MNMVKSDSESYISTTQTSQAHVVVRHRRLEHDAFLTCFYFGKSLGYFLLWNFMYLFLSDGRAKKIAVDRFHAKPPALQRARSHIKFHSKKYPKLFPK